jgi:hypothetical protein
MNAKMTGNPTQVYTIHIHLYGLLAHFIRIAVLFRFGRVLAATVHAADAL